MCGIVAVINGQANECIDMLAAISPRGNSSHLWQSDNVIVGFRYLSITDQDAPAQPFRVGDVSVWLNGYISNYRELAAKYRIKLSTKCDTELLAHFISAGIRPSELNGFFSVLYFNHKSKRLHGFCDRYGAKQMYEYSVNGTTYIASEVRAISAVTPLELRASGVSDWHYSLGVMTDTIYAGVTGFRRVEMPTPSMSGDSYEVACVNVRRLLDQSFERNRADNIATGVFLSGGIDSGIIAKFMQPDYSFSVDYLIGLSEIEGIKKNSTGIHYTMICNDAMRDKYAPLAAAALDVPKAGSCYTNFAITELASKFCVVIYSGAGGDEVFKGYTHRYDKPVSEVICRNGNPNMLESNMSHEDYDWAYLRTILTVEDRMTGRHTMECRYPLLDNDLVDYARSLPLEFKLGKRILKDVCGLDDEVISAPKRGFCNPHFTNSEWTKFVINERRNI